jgi:hypothetical protein
VRLDIFWQPHLILPAVGADRRRVTAPVVPAVDQHVANAEFAHLSEGDFLGAGWSWSSAQQF